MRSLMLNHSTDRFSDHVHFSHKLSNHCCGIPNKDIMTHRVTGGRIFDKLTTDSQNHQLNCFSLYCMSVLLMRFFLEVALRHHCPKYYIPSCMTKIITIVLDYFLICGCREVINTKLSEFVKQRI